MMLSGEIMANRIPRLVLAPLTVASLAIAGCSARTVPALAPATLNLHGSLHGVQLFDATLASPGLSVPLLAGTVLSGADGSFNITGQFACPAPSDQVYLVAQGGDAGAGPNSGLVLMSALGNCGDLTSSTTVSINEVSTVATVFAYGFFFNSANFANGGYLVGGDSIAYTNFRALVDPASGTALATNGPDIQLKLNALANSVATCINSASVNGQTPACADLLAASAPVIPVNTNPDSAASLNLISNNLTYNVTSVFYLATPTAPFQPTLTTPPTDWDMHLTPRP
jgi:hypothetical protein